MRYIVDRIERDFLILEGEAGALYQMPRALLPEAAEGDCVDITVNRQATEARRRRIAGLLDELFDES